jgi:small GTP-binding protein
MELSSSKSYVGRLPVAKVVLYGREGTGKSALMMRYACGRFDTELESTIGAAFNCKKVTVGDKEISLQIWDTAGSERFDSIVPMYIRGAKVVLLCFDEPDIPAIKAKITKVHDVVLEITIILVATKMDMSEVERYTAIDDFASSNRYELYYTSAKNGMGVDMLFDRVAELGLLSSKDDVPTSGIVSFDIEPKKTTWCCWY